MKLLEVTPELIGNVWNLLQRPNTKSIWFKLEGRSLESFARTLLASPVVFGWNFGIMHVSHVYPGHSVRLHPLFWSKDVFRNLDELKESLEEIFDTGLDRIEIVTPREFHAGITILNKLGFRLEGHMRKFYKLESGECADGVLWATTR